MASKTKSNGTTTTEKVEGHGKPIKLNNGAVLYNDDRPHGKSGKGGVVKVHGTSTGYQRGCRCDECKAAMAAYTTTRREARKDEGTTTTTKAKATTKATAGKGKGTSKRATAKRATAKRSTAKRSTVKRNGKATEADQVAA